MGVCVRVCVCVCVCVCINNRPIDTLLRETVISCNRLIARICKFATTK